MQENFPKNKKHEITFKKIAKEKQKNEKYKTQKNAKEIEKNTKDCLFPQHG